MHDLIIDKKNNLYKFDLGDSIAQLEFILVANRIYLLHIEISPDITGQGIGSALVLATLKDIEAKGYLLIATCPFVLSYINKHPEWKKLTKKRKKSKKLPWEDQ